MTVSTLIPMVSRERLEEAFQVMKEVIYIETGEPYDNQKFLLDDIIADLENIIHGRIKIVTTTSIVRIE